MSLPSLTLLEVVGSHRYYTALSHSTTRCVPWACRQCLERQQLAGFVHSDSFRVYNKRRDVRRRCFHGCRQCHAETLGGIFCAPAENSADRAITAASAIVELHALAIELVVQHEASTPTVS